MEFQRMKRKDLQALCKKHRIPANLKKIEMATRLSSVFEKETEETLTNSISLYEDSLEADGIKDDLVVSKEAKKVRFSSENEVFEFTRSVKRCRRKYVRTRSKGPVKDLQESGIELRRSKRSLAKGKTIDGSIQNESNTRRGCCSDVTKALKVPRRSKRIASSGSNQEECKVTKLMALEQFEFEEELVKNNVKEVSMDFEVQKTRKYHKNDVKDDPQVEKVPRRFVNDIDVQTNTQDQRRSLRLKAKAANLSMGGETSDGRLLCSTKESKEEIKTKLSKRSTVVNSQEGELVKNKTKEPLIDFGVQTTENYRRMKVQDVSKAEKFPRRSKRLGNDINMLMDKRPVKAVKREKSLSEFLVDGQAQKGDRKPKSTKKGLTYHLDNHLFLCDE